MAAPSQFGFYYLWVAPRVLQVFILAILMKRGLLKRFPVFEAYTGFTLVAFAVLFALDHLGVPHATYFEWYWPILGISICLRFAVVGEISAHLFDRPSSSRTLITPLLRWTSVFLSAISVFLAAYTHPSGTDPVWFNVHVLERSANIVFCGLILTLFICSRYLHLAWPRIDFGIAFGFGVLCSSELALAAVRSQFGLSAHLALDLVDMGIYHVCVLIWLIFLLLPERRPSVLETSHIELETWHSELQQLSPR